MKKQTPVLILGEVSEQELDQIYFHINRYACPTQIMRELTTVLPSYNRWILKNCGDFWEITRVNWAEGMEWRGSLPNVLGFLKWLYVYGNEYTHDWLHDGKSYDSYYQELEDEWSIEHGDWDMDDDAEVMT